MTEPDLPHAGDRLRRVADDFLALHHTLKGSKPVAGIPAFDPLSSPYATAQGLATTTLGLLLTASAHPLAHSSRAGHHAIEYLGHTLRLASTTATHLADAIALAAEYHRIDGQPDPATGRTLPRRPQRRDSLDTHLQAAARLLREGYLRATDAAEFLDAAQHHGRPPQSPDPERALATAPATTAPRLTSAQRGALRMISRGYARLYESANGKEFIETGTSTKITMATLGSLRGKGFVEQERDGSPLYVGRRLLLTPAGQQALDTATEITVSGPAPAPARASAVRSR
ncbi:hypothetical protein A8W25_30825 [Streptomyces sp. ERV7]|uniref:hypothetical protein n=1 Tax=Streptomyces sp. ERV7 TaxID=1322334 RepID=UPI0007F37055|nr:hypothetical protein [Streptomyces sp. ERV7]OAR21873.1 hypothetical protein A8W25_30825 [Streptomyces sp. ERV7]